MLVPSGVPGGLTAKTSTTGTTLYSALTSPILSSSALNITLVITDGASPTNKSSHAAAMSKTYPSSDSEKDAAISVASSTESETSPATERDSKSCEPVSTKAQRRSTRRQKSHGPEVWEALKLEIAQLYLDENRTLEVRWNFNFYVFYSSSGTSFSSSPSPTFSSACLMRQSTQHRPWANISSTPGGSNIYPTL
ncbi:hypothetical protein F5Y10DRAFT_8115 [Nemania abortiva]|nr:hypothetical protein F5Y10DRAFT_8115 [Nemania abortiva]